MVNVQAPRRQATCKLISVRLRSDNDAGIACLQGRTDKPAQLIEKVRIIPIELNRVRVRVKIAPIPGWHDCNLRVGRANIYTQLYSPSSYIPFKFRGPTSTRTNNLQWHLFYIIPY